MNYTEADYISAGYNYERAKSATAQAQTIRRMLESERIDERAEARRLIEQGRAEARTIY